MFIEENILMRLGLLNEIANKIFTEILCRLFMSKKGNINLSNNALNFYFQSYSPK